MKNFNCYKIIYNYASVLCNRNNGIRVFVFCTTFGNHNLLDLVLRGLIMFNIAEQKTIKSELQYCTTSDSIENDCLF